MAKSILSKLAVCAFPISALIGLHNALPACSETTDAKAPVKVATQSKKPPATRKSADTKSDSKQAKSSAAAKAPAGAAADKLVYTGPPVLDPSQFFGAAAMGYAAAKTCPEVMAKLFCYCGCDISDSHNHLIDCFTSSHGVECHICQEEAVLALKMHRDNASIADIQKAVDQQYSEKYPWKEDSPAYTHYKHTREWKPFADSATSPTASATASTTGSTSSTAAGPEPAPDCEKPNASTGAKPWKPVLKPGYHKPTCCTAEHKDKQDKK